MWQIATMLADLALGGMAYHLALRIYRVQEKQTIILDALVSRVQRLENGHNSARPLGFVAESEGV